jgi:dephospho-CoA kinase
MKSREKTIMLIVSLTGNIASGKSIAAKILKDLGCYIHHSDKVAHELMKTGAPAWEAVVSRFSRSILNKDGSINRKKLGAIIFANKKERLFLNKLIHPLVLEKKKEIIKKVSRKGDFPIFISEAALTIEAGYADFFDKVVLVYCSREIQIKRLMERDKITEKKALIKINSQMPADEKKSYADYIIDTSGSLEDTLEQTERIYRQLLADHEFKTKTMKV